MGKRLARLLLGGAGLFALGASAVLAQDSQTTVWVRGGERYVRQGLDLGRINVTGDYLTNLDGELNVNRTTQTDFQWNFRYHPLLSVYTREPDQRRFSHVLSAGGTFLFSPRASLTASDSFYRIRQQIGVVDLSNPDSPTFLINASSRTSNAFDLHTDLDISEKSRIQVGGNYALTRLSNDSLAESDVARGHVNWSLRPSPHDDLRAGYDYADMEFSNGSSFQVQLLDMTWSRTFSGSNQGEISAGVARVQGSGMDTTEPSGGVGFNYTSPSSRLHWTMNIFRNVGAVAGLAGPVVDRRLRTSLQMQFTQKLQGRVDAGYGQNHRVLNPTVTGVKSAAFAFHLDYHWTPRFFGTFSTTRNYQRSPLGLYAGRRYVDYYFVGIGYEIYPREGRRYPLAEGGPRP